jgi:membrane protease YdiL (CAAX protease family)
MRPSARLPWVPRAAWAHRHAPTLETGIVLAAVASFSLARFPRTTGGVLAAAAVWALLTLAAMFIGRPRAIHLTLLAGLGAVLKLAAPRLWPGLVPWLAALGLYLLVLHAWPALRVTADWARRGSLDPGVRWLVLAVIPVAAAGLVVWVAAVGEAGLSEGARLAIRQTQGVPLWVVVPVGLLFACLNAAVEEAFYRGVIMHALLGTVGTMPALVLQAAAFGLLHTEGFPSGPAGVTLTAGYGLVLGVIRLKAGGLLAPWLAHVLADLTIVAVVASYAAVSPQV